MPALSLEPANTRVQVRQLPAVRPTPLVKIEHPDLESGTQVFAKLESVHPGGSIKDRSVSRILTKAIEQGKLDNGRRLLDSSSGNAGIAYAMIGAQLGVPITLVVPANASLERLNRIRAHGAELILTDPMEGYDEAIRHARRLAREQPETYWYADQYGNENNWRAHYETTGVEILDQVTAATGEPPDAFVAGVGTGGTFTGVGRRLRSTIDTVRLATVVPEIFPGIEGLKPLGAEQDIVPEILDESLIEQRFDVAIEEAVGLSHWLSKQGLFVGPSSGANLAGALRLAKGGDLQRIVTTFNDTGERYLSTGMWDHKS